MEKKMETTIVYRGCIGIMVIQYLICFGKFGVWSLGFEVK